MCWLLAGLICTCDVHAQRVVPLLGQLEHAQVGVLRPRLQPPLCSPVQPAQLAELWLAALAGWQSALSSSLQNFATVAHALAAIQA